jgi:predicted MFS family arabinose efflux permease
MPLERANALAEGASRVSILLGAPLAGLLITLIGASNLLWFDGASFACSALLIGLAVPSTPPLVEAGGETPRYLATLWEGLRFLHQDALLSTIVVTVMIMNLLDGAFLSVVEPAYIKSVFQSALPFGLLLAAVGGATCVGTLIFGAVGPHLPRRRTLGLGIMINGAFRYWGLLWPLLPALFVGHLIAGLAFAPVNPLIDTVMQERLPIQMRARVLGTVNACVLVGIPLGTLASGYLVTWMGLRMTLVAMGTVYLVTTLSLLIHPALRHMEKPST